MKYRVVDRLGKKEKFDSLMDALNYKHQFGGTLYQWVYSSN